MLNVVAVRGRLSRPAEERVLQGSGERLLSLELSVRREGAQKADCIPVAWRNPPAAARELTAGEEVVVVGHVARRFFRSGGTTQSRTEVVAHAVVPARRTRKAGAALWRAAAEIDAACEAKRT